MHPEPEPVIIIGAGVAGLTLAHSLQKQNIPFKIFERDASISAKSGGWGLTIHWGLPALRESLNADVLERIPETYVNKEAVRNGEDGRYQFFDLSSGEARYNIPAAERIRVSRMRLKGLLAEGLDIQWSKTVKDVESTEESVTVYFEDGTSCTGCILAACDGSRSRVRSILYPSNYKNYKLPIRFLGATAHYTVEQAAQVRAIDPVFFQGTDSRTDTYLYFSFLDTPHNFEDSSDKYVCQIVVSWPFRPGFLGENEPLEVPQSHTDRVSLMKRLTATWAEPFRSLVHNLPDDNEAVCINLEDWIPEKGAHGTGRIALVGDAAHSMTMFRGEGANNALADVQDFVNRLGPHLPKLDTSMSEAGSSSRPHEANDTSFASIRAAIDAYEDEVNSRGIPGVLASRQACLDAHEYGRINDESPLVKRRIVMPL
ncbi:hypothetical protein FQN54_000487 [Arachnomyces sp. PD_36]|nr:hypothetical protein FQN54_000487 [Arachnomyces sp. PD_36]